MEKAEYCFQVSPLDVEKLMPQASAALEKRTQLLSRSQYPGIWKMTDRLNAIPKTSEHTLKWRRVRTRILALVCLILGIVLFVPGLMSPKELLAPLIAGAIGIGAGIGGLWRSRKKKKNKNPFDKSAKILLEGKENLPAGQMIQVFFLQDGMKIDIVAEETDGKESDAEFVPYGEFERAIETKDLVLLVHDTRVTVLQKKDMVKGNILAFGDFLSTKTAYASAMPEANSR